MKRIFIFFLSVFLLLCLNGTVFGQKSNEEVINHIIELRASEGALAARNHIEKLLNDSTIDSELSDALQLLWGRYTSNIWNMNPTDSIPGKYREFLEENLIPFVNNDSSQINENNIYLIELFAHDFARIHFIEGDYKEAANYLSKIISWYDTIPEVYGTNRHINALDEYYTLLINNLQRYEEALPYVEKNIQLIENVNGILSKEYAIALYQKSICLFAVNKRMESVATIKLAIDTYRKTSNIDHLLLAQMENDLKTIESLVDGDSHLMDLDDSFPDQLSMTECMSLIISGRYDEALPSLYRLKRDMEQVPILDTLSYTSLVVTLSSALLSVGKINEARVELENLKLKIDLNNLPPQFAATYYNNVSVIDCNLKRYSESIQLGKKALAHYSEMNEIGLEYIKVLGNISICYSELGDYVHSKMYIDEAVDLFFKNIDSAMYQDIAQTLLNNKALVSLKMHDYETAEKIWTDILRNPILKEQNLTAYGLAANNLAFLYFVQNRWAEAIPLLENLRGDNEEYNYYYYQHLALAYLYTEQVDSAIVQLQKFNDIAVRNCTAIYSHFPENERENYWYHVAEEMLMINNLIGFLTQKDSAISLAYNNKLFCGNLFLESHSYIANQISSQDNPELNSKYLEHNRLKSFLSHNKMQETERKDSIKKLYDLEREIINQIPNLEAHLWNSVGTWKDVKESLSENELAIEFAIIPLMPTPQNLSWHYGAFILKKNYSCPKLILLDEEDAISDIISNNDPTEIFINNLYSTTTSEQLYTKIWRKIDPYTENISTIYYTPTGLLSNLNFDLLENDKKVSLAEKYNMVRVSSTKYISDYKNQRNSNIQTASLYGNISYDETISEMSMEGSKYSVYTGEDISESLMSRSVNDRGKWGVLPYTKNEIDSIYTELKANHITTQLYEKEKANEESFKSLDGNSPDIIHLATHGFVIDTEKKATGNKFVASTSLLSAREGYLMWCGLMMAGANNAWTGNFNVDNVEDGILTADEISRLDLSNTKLVVLSACETARGKIDPVEGVLGLQRAFKKAGVQTIVMSLWKVPDESTSILMAKFYKGLMNGIERHQALKDAMNYVKTLYPDPYYWAGFIMLD